MVIERILPEHVPRILSDKPLMEHFLRVLLDGPVTLSDWPSEASCSDFSAGPDLCAVTTGGMRICLHVNLFGAEPMMDELMHAAAQYLPDPVCTIVLTASDPVDLGQSYSRIAPMAVDAPVITEVESAWQIHVLSFAAEIVNRNAPPEIQQLLDHMAGKEIQPAPGSLLDRMLHEDFAWSPIADMRSRCKASIYACCTARLKLGADRRSIRSAAQSISENALSAVDLSELYAKLTQLAARNLSDTELQIYFHQTGIPAELYRDALDGITWDAAYLHVRFDQALQEEAERRRAAVEEGGERDGSL